MSFFSELKRRGVSHAGIVYMVAAWLPIQVTDRSFPRIGPPGSAVTPAIAHPGNSASCMSEAA